MRSIAPAASHTGRHVGWRRAQNNMLLDQTAARVVRRYEADVGRKTSTFSRHSLRAGLVTSAIQARVDPLDVQRHSGHASFDMLKRYIRDATVFRGNPTAKLGL